jgi:hypothetical protein
MRFLWKSIVVTFLFLVCVWLIGFLGPLPKRVFEHGWKTWEQNLGDDTTSHPKQDPS